MEWYFGVKLHLLIQLYTWLAYVATPDRVSSRSKQKGSKVKKVISVDMSATD